LTRTLRQIEQFRQGDACIQVCDAHGRPCDGVRVWVEQEDHEFRFGCAVPDLTGLSEPDRCRYRERLDQLFHHREPIGQETADRVEVTGPIHLGVLRLRLERLASQPDAQPLDVHVWGRAIGPSATDNSSEREAAHRAIDLYALCFAQPQVCGIVWHGFWVGEGGGDSGLLRQDFSPRPAYRYLQKLIHVIWHTRADGETDSAGQFRFRGFFGAYRVAVRIGEQPATVAAFSLRRSEEKRGLVVVVPQREP
jgi:hypothetical protein